MCCEEPRLKGDRGCCLNTHVFSCEQARAAMEHSWSSQRPLRPGEEGSLYGRQPAGSPALHLGSKATGTEHAYGRVWGVNVA